MLKFCIVITLNSVTLALIKPLKRVLLAGLWWQKAYGDYIKCKNCFKKSQENFTRMSIYKTRFDVDEVV